jgi:hypothetical protein
LYACVRACACGSACASAHNHDWGARCCPGWLSSACRLQQAHELALRAVGRPAPDDPVANYLAHSVSRRELALVRQDLLALRDLQAEMAGVPQQSMALRHEMQGERVSAISKHHGRPPTPSPSPPSHFLPSTRGVV